jgi:hypothetical protein
MDGDGHDVPVAATAGDGHRIPSCGGSKMNFRIGDRVQMGTRDGTITDVGTVLIQVKPDEGGLRVVCPWELVKILG